MPTMHSTAAAALIVAGTVAAAAAPGALQVRPGEPTKAEVYIKNPDYEPVPVVVEQIRTDAPLRVRVVAPAWDYRTVLIRNADEAARVLSSVGAEGWETTGVSWPEREGTVLMLKKPR